VGLEHFIQQLFAVSIKNADGANEQYNRLLLVSFYNHNII